MEGDVHPFKFVTESDADLHRWLEVKIVFSGKGESVYAAILCPGRNRKDVIGVKDTDTRRHGMRDDLTVFVDIPEPVQSPQFRGLVSIPMMVGLKRLDNFDGFGWNSDKALPKGFSRFGVIDSENRKASGGVLGSVLCQRQGASEMVQGCTEARDYIANDEAQFEGKISDQEMHDVLSSFKIILERHRVTIALQKLADLHVQSAQVVLRPTNLQASIEVPGRFV